MIKQTPLIFKILLYCLKLVVWKGAESLRNTVLGISLTLMILKAIYKAETQIAISTLAFSELQTHLSNCLFDFITWMPHRHIKPVIGSKLLIFTIYPPFPISPPQWNISLWAACVRNLTFAIRSAAWIDPLCSLSTSTHLVQVTFISTLDYTTASYVVFQQPFWCTSVKSSIAAGTNYHKRKQHKCIILQSCKSLIWDSLG